MSQKGTKLLIAPVEATSSFIRGSCRGPHAVLDDLRSVELFNSEGNVSVDPSTLDNCIELPSQDRMLHRALDWLEAQTEDILCRGDSFLMLGGEHTVSLGPLRSARRVFSEIGVIQFDAHGDLRDSYEGRKLSHGCVMRRAVTELDVPLLGIGIRSVCREETDFLSSNENVSHIRPRQCIEDKDLIIEHLEKLPSQIYLTFDMDVFDPSVAPGVGTPEAGGLDWYHVSSILDIIAKRKKVVCADIVELAPSVEKHRTVRLASRIAIRVLHLLRQN